jgi:hypothetical protein
LGCRLLATSDNNELWMSAQELIDASQRHELDAPNTDVGTLGRLLGKCFENDICILDGMVWQRKEILIARTSGQSFLQKRYWVFLK